MGEKCYLLFRAQTYYPYHSFSVALFCSFQGVYCSIQTRRIACGSSEWTD